MAKTLVIVESGTKAKTIGKFLGSNYTVKASVGHVRDLPKSQLGVDIENDFEPKYITIRGKGDTIKELKGAAKKVDRVLLATDPDREGEAIAWHLEHILNIEPNSKCRIEFNEITKEAIKKAAKNPRQVNGDRVDAQQTRRILDRLVGYQLSPLLWRKIRKGLSAGRVQSVAVRLICDREEEISNFTPEEYWSVIGNFKTLEDSKIIEAKLEKKDGKKIELPSQEEVNKALSAIKKAKFAVQAIRKKEKRRNPAAPFITSSLQQEAYRKLNFQAKKTMRIAQELYEGLDLGKEGTVGLVTYIRTDSTRISDTAKEEAREFINDKYGKEYYPEEPRNFTNKGKSQDAHEAIRPTSIFREPEQVKKHLGRDQIRLYKLIWERFIASQMASAVVDTTSIDITGSGYTFRAKGSIVKFPGFMKIYTESQDTETDKGSDKILPDLEENQKLDINKLDPKQHFTQPPPRYTDASLIKTLEEKGIGRPSTYATIVDTVQKRGYVVREEKQFYPTELGILVIDLLREHFKDILNIEFTADMEDLLDKVEDGDTEGVKVLRDFYSSFRVTLEKAEEEIGEVELVEEVSDEKCELCDRNLVVKFGRFGKFLACPGFPECRFTKPLLETAGVPCPKCGGDVVSRRSKKGRKFFGCSNYPECEFISWDKPTDKACPVCQENLVEKNTKKKKVLKCSGENCKYSEDAQTEED